MEHRLRKSNILRGYRSFSRILSTGKSLKFAPLRCFYLVEPSRESRLQVGFSVSRSVRRAVDRNRIRRQMREAFRRQGNAATTKLNTSSSLTIVFMYTGSAPKGSRGVRYDEIKESVTQLLAEIGKSL